MEYPWRLQHCNFPCMIHASPQRSWVSVVRSGWPRRWSLLSIPFLRNCGLNWLQYGIVAFLHERSVCLFCIFLIEEMTHEEGRCDRWEWQSWTSGDQRTRGI